MAASIARRYHISRSQKDAELLALPAMAGQLTPVKVPDEFIEAYQHLTR